MIQGEYKYLLIIKDSFLLLCAFIFFIKPIYAKEFTTEVAANVNIESYELPDKTIYSIYKDKHTWKNSLGDFGKGSCMGSIYREKENFLLEIFCEEIDQNKEKYWTRVRRGLGDEESGAGNIEYIGGTGKYIEMIGTKCKYAVTYYDRQLNFSKSKCKIN